MDHVSASLNPGLEWIPGELAALADQALQRRMRQAEILPHGHLRLDGRDLLNLCGNDYLGLMLELRPPAGVPGGATASRLISGNHPMLSELEAALAAWHQAPAALVFGSGYLANLGCLQALLSRDDVVFSDRLSHASLIDGITLSRARHVRFRHNDLNHLEDLLRAHAGYRRRLIVTEAVFSMDGDGAPLTELVELKERWGAMLLVDEAHGIGVFGPAGRGLAAAAGVNTRIDVLIGTLSKAAGVYGGYVIGAQPLIDYLVNRARTLIYSTGLPPTIGAAALQAVSLIRAAADRRRQLLQNAAAFRRRLQQAGLVLAPFVSPIVPVVVGGNGQALALSDRLHAQGVAALAIRPPTVPRGSSRVRFSISAVHQEAELRRAADVVSEWLAEVKEESQDS